MDQSVGIVELRRSFLCPAISGTSGSRGSLSSLRPSIDFAGVELCKRCWQGHCTRNPDCRIGIALGCHNAVSVFGRGKWYFFDFHRTENYRYCQCSAVCNGHGILYDCFQKDVLLSLENL